MLCVRCTLCGVTDLLFMLSCHDLEFGLGLNKRHALQSQTKNFVRKMDLPHRFLFSRSGEVSTLMTRIPDPAFSFGLTFLTLFPATEPALYFQPVHF